MERPYYTSVMQRRNPVKEIIYAFFKSICSLPRLLLEVFTRRNMGERYYSTSSVIMITIIMAIAPIGDSIGIDLLSDLGFSRRFDILKFLLHDLTWYVFLAAFVAKSFDRYQEIQRLPSVYEGKRFSLTTGHIDRNIKNYVLRGHKVSTRTIETIVEPGIWFMIGFLLHMMQQHIGLVIVFSSICYSFSYFAAYHDGDEYVANLMDQRTLAEEATNTFVDELPEELTRGVQIRARRPANPELRRLLVPEIVGKKDAFEVM